MKKTSFGKQLITILHRFNIRIHKFSRHLFQKKINSPDIEKENIPSNKDIKFYSGNYDFTNILPHLNEVKAILKIDVSEIIIVPYLVDNNGVIEVMDDTYYDIKGQGIVYNIGFYNNENGILYISYYNHYSKEPFSESEILITIIHELRHRWQAEYKYDKYYNGNNAVGIEHVSDISEIDADAFSVAYMNSKTSYEKRNYMWNMNVFLAMDGGNRKERINELRIEYALSV